MNQNQKISANILDIESKNFANFLLFQSRSQILYIVEIWS